VFSVICRSYRLTVGAAVGVVASVGCGAGVDVDVAASVGETTGALVRADVGVGDVVAVCVTGVRVGVVLGFVAEGVEEAAGPGVELGNTTVAVDAAVVAVGVGGGGVD